MLTTSKTFTDMAESPEPCYPDIPFRAIVEQSLAGIYILQDECFQYVNATFAGMLGYSPEEMIGLSLQTLVPPDFLDQVLDRYHMRLRGDPPSMRFVSRGMHKDSHVVMIEVHGSRMMYRGRPAVVGVGIDVTERLQREEELRQSRAQLQALTAHINTVREDQRAKFARDLHDVLGGMLTSMKMDVTRIMRRAQTREMGEIAGGLLELTQETIDTVRKLSEELRPSVLDHLGLQAAIERELAVFAHRYGVEARCESGGAAIRLSSRRATGIYRIFQQALTNIASHSAATQVRVHLDFGETELHLEVLDNGCGIDPLVSPGGSMGIFSMRQRASELGGSLELGPQAECGTKLRLTVPLAGEME
jgi:two-component system, NarL family, sensor histidine kinase UhpB